MIGLARARAPAAMVPVLHLAWLLAFSPAAASSGPQDDALYDFGEPAAWVDVAVPAYTDRPEAVADGASVLLFDRQIDVREKGDAYYEHFAVKVLNTVGIDAWSEISISVDPAWQSLRIHWLRVVRDGEIIDQRGVARITALPEESELRYRIYNGRYGIDVLLSDVRAGDVIEYAYTVSSVEKLFPGHFATRLYTAWSSPVLKERIRIRSALDRPLAYRLSERESAPEPETHGDYRVLVVERDDVEAIAGDGERPGWYDPWPYLEVSDLASWSDVSRLVAPLFAGREAGNRLAAAVSEIRAGGGTARQQALRAVQYVQEQIRYASIAIGRGSHEPAAPETVLARRFGDCKDKALLLATLLGRLGIEAHAALVHSTRGRALDGVLPTPYAFDHAIVEARIDGREYWVDPTEPTRYSPLSPDDPADFERALLVDLPSPALAEIPKPAPDTRHRELLMEFDLRDGVDAPASLQMTTRYRGSLADSMRPVLAQGSPEQRQADYANYIARYYPGARPSGPVTIEDRRERNVIEVTEHYTLPHTFTRAEGDDFLSFFLHTDELYRYGEPLESSVREAPLAIAYPASIRQRMIVRLPEPWTVERSTLAVDNPAFRYSSDVGYSAQTLELDYRYEALSDHVPLADLPQYEKDRRRFYDDTGFSLTYDPTPEDTAGSAAVAPLPAVILLLTLAGSVWAALARGRRYDPPPRAAPAGAPAGIRGWLLLPAIGVLAGPVLFGWILYAWGPFLDAELWQTLPSIVSDGWQGTAQAALLSMMAFALALLVGYLLAAVLFFRKRTSLPAVFIGLSWTSVLFGVVISAWTLACGLDTETTASEFTADAVRDALTTSIWTAYMLKSARVRATFVNRAPAEDVLRAPQPAAG